MIRLRRKEVNVLLHDVLIPIYLRLSGAKHLVKDQSESETVNPLPPLHGLLFLISSKGLLYALFHSQDSSHKGLSGTSRGALTEREKLMRYLWDDHNGFITPNQIPLTTIVTYFQKRYRSRISNHWATIPACSVVPPIYKQSKKTYCHISF